jgi:hypothetical protein
VSREKVLQIGGRNVFDIHLSWSQYPVKIQNYTGTIHSNGESQKNYDSRYFFKLFLSFREEKWGK